MSQNKWIDCFNTKFEEFVKDLILLYPDDKDFKMLKNSFNLVKLADIKKPYELFQRYSSDFEEYVMKRDESFFLNHDYTDVVKDETNFTDELIKKLKTYWKTLNEDNKKVIWDYLTLFFTLKKKINSI